MIANQYIELMHRELDGRNSAKDSARLNTYLTTNLAAQQFYDELQTMSAMMKQIKPVEPPAHLQHAIMNALPARRYPAASRLNVFSKVLVWWEEQFNVKYAYAFAGGLALGIVLFALVSQTALQPSEWDKLSGTMGLSRELKPVAQFQIAQAEVAGTIHLRGAGEFYVIELVLTSQQRVEMSISFDEERVRFKGFTTNNATSQEAFSLMPNTIRLTHAGDAKHTLIFEKKKSLTSVVYCRIYLADSLLYEQALSF